MDEMCDDTDAGWHDLADALWAGYPRRGGEALTTPTASFPGGTLLGRYRLDPLDAGRRHGLPVDVLDGAGGAAYDPIRDALQERAGRAALVTDTMLDELFEFIEARFCGEWDAPWRLFGLVGADATTHQTARDLGVDPATMVEMLRVVQLVPAGLGHPGEALDGLIAPPSVFGLWLLHEGYERNGDGNRVGEIRMHLVALADGRWGLRHVRRNDSVYRPGPASTIGGSPAESSRRSGDDGSFSTTGFDAIAGFVPEMLARVLQVAVDPAVDPYEGLLRLLARAAGEGIGGGDIAGLARIDPTTIAAVGVPVDTGVAGDGTDTSVDLLEYLVDAAVRAGIDRDGDWLDAVLVAGVSRQDAIHAAAGVYRAVESIDDTAAGWLGSELLAARAAERAGPVAAGLAALVRRNPAMAGRVAWVIEQRRAIWGVEADDDTTMAVRMALAGAVGRNDPCPCGSGRKAKHCCQR